MKKSFLIAATSAIILAGCAESDTLKPIEEMPIGFTKVYIENVTKAITTGAYTTANFETVGNTFGVFGYKNTGSQTNALIFDNQKVEYQSGLNTANGYNATTDWAYTPIKYWDKSATSYNFYAYAPHNGDFTGTAALSSNAQNAFTITGFEQANTQPGMIDLMTDLTSKQSVTGTAIGTNDVAFTFGHILSNINLTMAVSPSLKADETNNPVRVQSITIGAVKLDGNYGYDTNAYKWTLKDGSRTATFSGTQTSSNVFASGALKASDDKFTNVPGLTDLLFVPQTVDATYKIVIRYFIGTEQFDKEILLSEFKKEGSALETWAPGNKYTYQLIIGPNPILFDISGVTDWTDGGTYTYTIE